MAYERFHGSPHRATVLRNQILAAALALLAFAAAGCSGSTSSSTTTPLGSDNTRVIRLHDNAFDANSLTLAQYVNLVFENDDAVDHAVVITLRGSPAGSRILDQGVQPGATTTTVLASPGTYDVWDRFFGGPGTGMHMTIRVNGPTPAMAPAGILNVTLNDGAYDPVVLDVEAHQTVQFRNAGTLDHTVTIVQSNSPPGTFVLDTDLQPGGIGVYNFPDAGTYDIYCRHQGGIGAGMHMTVHVE